MALILKNSGSDAYTYAAGTVIAAANANTPVSSDYWFALVNDINFIADLRKNNLTVNDGNRDYSHPESEVFVRQLINTDNISNRDTDGAVITRNKAAKKGWTFCSLPFEFQTSRLMTGNIDASDDFYSKESTGADRSFITLKVYDANNNEITSPGALGVNYANAVKTVIDFEPPYDYEIIGGDLRTLTSITTDMRLWLIAAPDIPAPTGSKEMGGGINLKYLSPGNIWSVDGRVTKYATYNAIYHTNKIRLIFKYTAGANEELQVIIQLYKQ